MIRLHSLGTRITSRSVRRSCTARCEGLAPLGTRIASRSDQTYPLGRAKTLCSSVQRPFARARGTSYSEREGHLIPSERDTLFRAREPASFERVNGGLRGIKSRRCRSFVENRNLYRPKISKMLKYTQK